MCKVPNRMSTVDKLDCKIRQHYLSFNKSYPDLFKQWCDDNSFDDGTIIEDLEGDADECQLIDFDEENEMPFDASLNQQEKVQKKFELLTKWCFQSEDQQRFQEQALKNIKLDVTEEDLLETYKIYTSNNYLRTWHSANTNATQLTDINVLYLITISRLNNNDLSMHLIDSYKRCSLNQIINNLNQSQNYDQDITLFSITPEKDRLYEWINNSKVLKDLQQKLDKIQLDVDKIEQGMHWLIGSDYSDFNYNQSYPQKCAPLKLDLGKMIKNYPCAPRLMARSRLIDDDLEMVSKYIAASSKLIHKIMKDKKGPAQIDVMILLKPSINNDTFVIPFQEQEIECKAAENENTEDHDNDLNEYYASNSVIYEHDIIPNIMKDLKDTNCTFHKMKLDDCKYEHTEEPDDIAQICYEYGYKIFQKSLKDVTEAAIYPTNKRFNVVFDRRELSKQDRNESDDIIFFNPPSDCNAIPSDPTPEIFSDLSRRCLIPRKGQNSRKQIKEYKCKDGIPSGIWQLREQSINARSVAQGQICLVNLCYLQSLAIFVNCLCM